MKTMIVAFALFAAASLGAAKFASAQGRVLYATVPFDFSVGGRLLPLGTYWISPSGLHQVRIASREKEVSAFATGSPNDLSMDGQARLVFDKVAGQYFLIKIVSTSVGTSVAFPMSKKEKRSQTLRASLHNDTRIVIAAK